MQDHHPETVVVSPEGMEVPAALTPSFEPLTEEQLVHLVDRLLVACEAVPLADDPTGELVCRLALTALQGAQGGVSSEDHQLALADIKSLKELLDIAWEKTVTVEFQMTDVETQSLAFQKKAERLEALMIRINNTLDLGSAYTEDQVPVKVLGKIRALESELGNSKGREALLRDQLTQLEGKIQPESDPEPEIDVVAERREARNEYRDKVLARLHKFQWSGKHGKFTFRKGGAVPCCPVCQGLDPDRVQHPDSGHQIGCQVDTFLGEIQHLS